MKKVVIFDLDGTIIDTLTDLQKSVNFALSELGYPLRTLEQVRIAIGNGVAKLIERSIPDGLLNENYAKCLEIFKNHYRNNYKENTHAYKGMFDTIVNLKKVGYIVTVATNKIIDVSRDLLDSEYPGVFDFIQGDAPGVKKKPDRNMIDNIIKHYQVKPEEVIYVGDTNVDEETALNAGIDYVLVTYGYRTLDEIKESCQCKTLLSSPKEIYNYLISLL